MKRGIALILSIGVILLTAGCQNAQTRAAEGAVIGGILGAGAGGIIGHQSRNAGEGVAIGAAVGAITGAIVGSSIPKQGQTIQSPSQGTQTVQSVSPNQVSMQQITDMSQQGVNENVIIDKIRLTNSRYNLTADDINYLKQKGATQKVIDTMLGK
jgi:uncharacterized protein YcfJ